MSKITVKRAAPPDVLKVVELRKRLLIHEKAVMHKNGAIDKVTELKLLHDCLGLLLDPYSILIMALDGENPVGMIALQGGNVIGAFQDRGVMVTWMYVDEAYRNSQVTITLVRMAENAVRQDANVSIQALVRADNTDMLEAAEGIGYRKVAHVLEKIHERTDIGAENGKQVHAEGGQRPPGGTGGLPPESELPTGEAVGAGTRKLAPVMESPDHPGC